MRAALFTLLTLIPAFAHAEIEAKKTKDTVEISDGGKILTVFHFGDFAKPVFYPLKSPAGLPLTRSWPFEKNIPGDTSDHPHQKSAWFCHGDVIVDGIKPAGIIKSVEGHDFWSEALGHGKIVATEVTLGEPCKGKVSFHVKLEWRSADGKKLFDETRVYTFTTVKGGWVMVMDSDIFASVARIIFGDTKEGSFGIRINDNIREANKTGMGKISNAEGLEGEKKCWGLISNWCDYSGTLDGKKGGITIFADSKNPHPTAWHVRAYGLMAANPFGRNRSGFPAQKGKTDLVTVEKGEHLRMRYGIYVHDGDAKEAGVAEVYKTFQHMAGGE